MSSARNGLYRTSKTSIVLTQAASLNDTLEVVAYDIATMATDTVSKSRRLVGHLRQGKC